MERRPCQKDLLLHQDRGEILNQPFSLSRASDTTLTRYTFPGANSNISGLDKTKQAEVLRGQVLICYRVLGKFRGFGRWANSTTHRWEVDDPFNLSSANRKFARVAEEIAEKARLKMADFKVRHSVDHGMEQRAMTLLEKESSDLCGARADHIALTRKDEVRIEEFGESVF
jgi:hypothetical protein